MKKEKWVKDNQGQLIITAGQVVWTTECEKALADPDQAKAALRHLKKKWISYLNKLTAITCSKLTKIERNKVCNSHNTCSSVTKRHQCTLACYYLKLELLYIQLQLMHAGILIGTGWSFEQSRLGWTRQALSPSVICTTGGGSDHH